MVDIYGKYNIIHINGYRYYVVDLKVREFYFENTVPYCFKIGGVEIFDSSWKGMIERLCVQLDELSPKSIDELLQIKNSWGKQAVFSNVKKTNYTPFKGIYVNTNHTAVHAMWTIQLLLEEYCIDLDKCQFIIRRLPKAEPKEVREFEKERAVCGFRSFLRQKYEKNDEFIAGIIKNIEIINAKIMPKLSMGYDDLFLIEAPNYYANYASKALDFAKNKLLYNESQLKIIDYSLSKLGKYIKKKHKEDKISFGFESSEEFTDLEDFPEDF